MFPFDDVIMVNQNWVRIIIVYYLSVSPLWSVSSQLHSKHYHHNHVAMNTTTWQVNQHHLSLHWRNGRTTADDVLGHKDRILPTGTKMLSFWPNFHHWLPWKFQCIQWRKYRHYDKFSPSVPAKPMLAQLWWLGYMNHVHTYCVINIKHICKVVDNPHVSLLLAGSTSHGEKVICVQWPGLQTSQMMMKWLGNVFRISGLLWKESTGHRWFPLTKGHQWWFIWCWPKRAVGNTVELPVIWDTMTLMWHHCNELWLAAGLTSMSYTPFTNTD